MKDKKLKTIDLFAGIGGIRMGFESVGFETVYANDFDEKCARTYDFNFKKVPLDIKSISDINPSELPAFDILLGGFPCQAFSIAGYRKGFADKGRGDLFFDITKIISKKKPKAILLENVKNLKSHDNGKTFRIIEQSLKDLGYYIKAEVLNSMEYGGVPQNRERIYIVGFSSKKLADKFKFPDKIKLKKKVSELLEKDVDEKYYYNHGSLLSKRLDKEVVSRDTVYQWRRIYVRENKKGVCPTLTANMGTGGHNVPLIRDHKGVRKLTPIECARIQGFKKSFKFPEDMADSQKYKQIGNSVTVPVIRRIALQMKKVLEN